MRIAHASEHFDTLEIGFVHAVGLAAHSGESQIVTLHVTQGRAEGRAPARPAELLERWGMGGARITHSLHECPGHDEIADELIAACDGLKPELLVMATHARTGLARVFAGSVAEAVARNVTVPSLLLPLESRGLIDPRSGALALDHVLIAGGSQRDAQLGVDAAAWFVHAVGASKAQLSLLHVDDGSPTPSVTPPAGLHLDVRVRRGSLESAVTSLEHELHTNLVVMATHGHDQLRDVLMSSHTERVLHEAKLPLLWIPSSFVA